MEEGIKEMEETLKALEQTGAIGYSSYIELISILHKLKVA